LSSLPSPVLGLSVAQPSDLLGDTSIDWSSEPDYSIKTENIQELLREKVKHNEARLCVKPMPCKEATYERFNLFFNIQLLFAIIFSSKRTFYLILINHKTRLNY
jgi:hypothetical protein